MKRILILPFLLVACSSDSDPGAPVSEERAAEVCADACAILETCFTPDPDDPCVDSCLEQAATFRGDFFETAQACVPLMKGCAEPDRDAAFACIDEARDAVPLADVHEDLRAACAARAECLVERTCD